ncbi:PKD domain-containing protein [Alistipes sp.]|uniref:PKD domain-containing protein n=1 Tax=Alistipes sp. TaxID=1872444 RepID=UPI003A869A5D
MKTRFNMCAVLLGVLLLGGCEEAVEPLHHTAPQVNFPLGTTTLTATVGEPVEFQAVIEQGDRLTCSWYVDDRLEASTPAFTYVFRTPGTFDVRFEARNGAGTVSRTYDVTVSDVLEMSLSVGDSTRIERLQMDNLRVMAIVTAGSDVRHEWSVDGAVLSDKAYFDSFVLSEARVYRVSYRGENTAGSFSKAFDVQVLERPLQIEFSNTDASISCQQGETVSITATVTFGGTGVQHEWTVDDETVSTDAAFSHAFWGEGPFTIGYRGVNAKGETVTRQWTVNILASGLLLDDFEGYTSLTAWWRTGENDPGVTVEDNPKPSGINTSAKVMRDKVNGTGSTSGYFTLETSKILEGRGIDVSKCTGIRFKVYLGKNKYYPRVDIGGTKYAPVSEPQFKDEWEVLEYRFPFNLDPTKIIQFRPLLQQNGSNIASGAVTETNTREVYIDDIEFLE